MERRNDEIQNIDTVLELGEGQYFTDAFWVTIETNDTNNVVDNVVDNRLKKNIELVTEDNQISASQMAKILNITSRTVQRDIGKLKNQNKLKRAGSEKCGHWVVTFFTPTPSFFRSIVPSFNRSIFLSFKSKIKNHSNNL